MYNTSQNYKDKILNDSTQHELNIYIDNNKIEPNHIIDFKSTLELFNNNEFCLGCTPEIDIEFEIDKRDLPEVYNEVYVETGIDGEVVPIGYFTIQKPIEDDEFKVKIKATDYMKKFEDNKYDGSNLNYPATMLQVLQDICTKIGVELGSTSFLNADKQIAVYDNTVTARTYIGYIAEQAGGFAVIGRDRKLYIKTFGEDTADIDINLFGDFKWGDKFSVSKVSYEDGTQNYKFGDETASTVYINQNNMYIVDSEQIENIYNQIKDFEVYSFEGETIIDPAYDIGDILIIDGKKVIYQGELEYAGKFKANIKSKIQAKTEQESMQTKSNSSEKIRRVQSEINQIDGKIEQLVEETSDQSQKLTKVEQTVDSISQKVSDIEDLTRTAEEIKTVTLENCIEANLLELHIYGNNTVFNYLLLDDKLTLDDDLYLEGDDLISVTDKDNNIKTYSLGITEALRQNNEVCDEFVLENGQAKVIRRVNKSGSTKAKESVENLGKLEIPLKEGTNTITINNYTARIKAKYVIKSTYSDTFATKVEMNSEIKQTKESIDLSVNKKLEDYSTTTEMSSAIKVSAENINSEVKKKVGNDEIISKINQSAESVTILARKLGLTANDVLDLISNNVLNLTAKNLVIQSTYFNVTKDGKVIITGNKNLIIGNTKSNYVALDPGEISLWDTSGGNLSIMPNALVMMSNYNSSSMTPDEISAPTITQTSLEEKKKNFEKMKDNAIEIINGIDIYRYNLKTENDKDKKHIGFVIGDKYNYSKEVTSLDNTGVDTYSFVSLCCKAIQELHAQIGNMHKEIEKLKGAKE